MSFLRALNKYSLNNNKKTTTTQQASIAEVKAVEPAEEVKTYHKTRPYKPSSRATGNPTGYQPKFIKAPEKPKKSIPETLIAFIRRF